MFRAFLYRIGRQLKHKPLTLVLLLVAVAYCVFMVFGLPALSEGEDLPVRDPSAVLGIIMTVLLLVLDFSVISGGSSFTCTTADVQFQLAGPFTQKFNLLLMIGEAMKAGIFFVYMICCYSTYIYSSFGLTSGDMALLLLAVFAGLFLGQIFAASENARIINNDGNGQNTYKIILGAVNAVFIIALAAVVISGVGGISGIKAAGFTGVLSVIGKSPVIMIMTAALVIFMILRTVLIMKSEPDYYEQAMASAQKMADMKAAKDAGLSMDGATTSKKLHKGSGRLNKGWGASVLFYKHLSENTRISFFSFVNKTAVFYRIFGLIMGLFMTKSIDSEYIAVYTVITVQAMFGGIIFSGGRVLTEFAKPYLFMIPEKNTTKIFQMLLAQLPEIIFDGIITTVTIIFFSKDKSALTIIAVFAFVVFCDYFASLFGILISRILPGLHGKMLVTVRSLLVYIILAGMVILTGVIGVFTMDVIGMDAVAITALLLAGITLVFNLIMLPVDAFALDRLECN